MPSSPWGSCVENDVATLKCIPVVLNNVIQAVLVFASIVAVVIVIVSGIRFIMSRGDPKKIQSAKASLAYALIGLAIVVLAFFAVNIIAYATGARCITTIGFTNCK